MDWRPTDLTNIWKPTPVGRFWGRVSERRFVIGRVFRGRDSFYVEARGEFRLSGDADRRTCVEVVIDANRFIKGVTAVCAAGLAYYLVTLSVGGGRWEWSAAGAATLLGLALASAPSLTVFLLPWNPERDRSELLHFLARALRAQPESGRLPQ